MSGTVASARLVEVDAWVRAHLGSAVTGQFFSASSMSEVAGIELADGRAIAVKVREGGPHLAASAAAQLTAQARGIACPALLAGPLPLAEGSTLWASAEQWRPEGAIYPSGDAPVAFARLLSCLVDALQGVDPVGLAPPPWLHYAHGTARIWPPAVSDRWDPHRIETDLPEELIVIARAARERLLASDLPSVVGHTDLNGLNVRWILSGGEEVPIVHDWDSISYLPEAVLVGNLAVGHNEVPGHVRIASCEASERLMRAYEVERGRVFGREEREVAWATSAWLGSYNAAFEYLHGAPGGTAAQILSDGRERLALAGCSP